IAAANFPRRTAIVRHEQRLLRADINVIRTVWILRDRVDWHFVRNVDLAPRLAAVARHEDAGVRSSDPDGFRLFRDRRNARRAWIKTAVRKLQPTLGRIDATIQTGVGRRQNGRL